MISTGVIVLGLAIDAAGALGIAVPDLRPRYKQLIRRYTPVLRGYVSVHEELGNLDDSRLTEESSLQQIEPLLERAWPAVRDHYEQQIRTNPNYSDGSIGGWETVELQYNPNEPNRGIVLKTPVRERPFNATTESYQNIVEQFLERKYRSTGWLLLVAGFTIQIVGTLL